MFVIINVGIISAIVKPSENQIRMTTTIPSHTFDLTSDTLTTLNSDVYSNGKYKRQNGNIIQSEMKENNIFHVVCA